MNLFDEDNPREKLLKYGIETLTDYELIAIILCSGTKKANVLEISKLLTKKYGIEKLSKISIGQLKKETGIGSVKACQICSCFEIARRTLIPNKKKLRINNAEDIFNLLHPKMKDLTQECLYCILLNARRYLLSEKKIFVGSLTESLINPREIFKFAIEENASAIILVHNHPSGECTPSQSDIESTSEIINAGNVLGIKVLDHIIIGQSDYWSLNENGFINS